ncbi:MAG TPA: GspE/PulE family protein [Gaiellaceae bacterium]|nr:GspE/PulE family protein [Gaiellaceae bacterium]
MRELVRPARNARALAAEFGLPFVELGVETVSSAAAGLIAPSLLRRIVAVPYRVEDGRLKVAVADPRDVQAMDDLRLATPLALDLAVAARAEIEAQLDALFSDPPAAAASGRGAGALVDDLVHDAAAEGASDIHLVPFDGDLLVRLRVDGVLRDARRIPRAEAPAAIARIKVLAQLDIAEHRRPQDGRFDLDANGAAVDVRVATLPTIEGEGAILRLLERKRTPPTLTGIGLSFSTQMALERVLNRTAGSLLVAGPTGSGKSTTLYAALGDLARPDVNIVTVEDPVEYRLPGAYQVQVNPKAGLTFATALRSIVRGDPDVLMVGEIRDVETARICIEAALTGHFVLSTLHANDAPNALTRLNDLGIEPYLTASAISAVLAQRLVRRLCTSCREPYAPAAGELGEATLSHLTAEPTFYRARGCERCRRGYSGRVGIFQLLTVEGNVARLAVTEPSHAELERVARDAGMPTLWQDGVEKAAAGVTSLDELRRVLH